MGKFIWNRLGRFFRVSLDELKNSPFKWGKDMICVKTMVDSLRLMQLLRLLKSGDNKSVGHINWWIGDFVEVLDDSLCGFSEVGLVLIFLFFFG